MQLSRNIDVAIESELSALVVGSQVASYAALVRPFERTIYLVALAFVNNAEEAVEIAQETVFRAFRSLATLGQAEQFKTWLIRIASSEARAFLRGRKQINCDDVIMDEEADDFEYTPHPLTQWDPRPIDVIKQKQTRDALREALEGLPRKDRVILFLRDVLRLTTTESAKVLGVSEQTIRKRLARARFELCGGLARWNGSLPQVAPVRFHSRSPEKQNSL